MTLVLACLEQATSLADYIAASPRKVVEVRSALAEKRSIDSLGPLQLESLAPRLCHFPGPSVHSVWIRHGCMDRVSRSEIHTLVLWTVVEEEVALLAYLMIVDDFLEAGLEVEVEQPVG